MPGFHALRQTLQRLVAILEQIFLQVTQPAHSSVAFSLVADLPRSKAQLLAENALLRQQPIILHRQSNTPASLGRIGLGSSCSPATFNIGKTPVLAKNSIRPRFDPCGIPTTIPD